MKRPTSDNMNGCVVTTPRVSSMMQLLGSGTTYKGNALSSDEFRAVKKLYGFQKEKPGVKPSPPKAPELKDFKSSWEYEDAMIRHRNAISHPWQDPQSFMQAGADRNVMREAETDGLRLLAWIAKYVPKGEDPLKSLIQAVTEAGWDIDPEDVEWSQEEA